MSRQLGFYNNRIPTKLESGTRLNCEKRQRYLAGENEKMGRGGRFGKYGEQKRLKRLRQKRTSAISLKVGRKVPERKKP